MLKNTTVQIDSFHETVWLNKEYSVTGNKRKQCFFILSLRLYYVWWGCAPPGTFDTSHYPPHPVTP
jgi:hypothetical protein